LPVLVLNASYEPINVCAARRAIVLVLKGVAMTEEEKWPLPACRACCHARALGHPSAGVSPLPHQSRALSRKNILLRDRNTCQYCSTTLPSGELNAGPCDSALARRPLYLGEPRRLLPIPATAAKATSFLTKST